MELPSVSYPITLRLLGANGRALPVVAELRYSVTDPLAVEAVFGTDTDAPVRWVFARDLLDGGRTGQVGQGDVVVGPSMDQEGNRVVRIMLRSPYGRATLDADADQIEDFLQLTWGSVPAGIEELLIDIEPLLDALTDEA
ncbi:MAG: SsgA family sporulation/cell division regulator [Jiangellaceae bacterium]